MTAAALPAFAPIARPATRPGFDLGPVARALIGISCFTMSFVCLLAVARGVLGMTPDLPHLRKIAVVIHVAAVLPAIPLGGYIMLARKGTARHRMLGKVWLVMMLVTATSAIFIQSGGGYSWLHLTIPVTFFSAWKTVATARRGDIAAHKRQLVFTYLFALLIPGLAAFAVPGRLMNVMLLG